MDNRNNTKGFTLIEVLIVLAVFALLAAIAIPQFSAYRKRAYNSVAQYGSAIIQSQFNKLIPGKILYNPPKKMKQGKNERVEVRIASRLTKELASGLKGSGEPIVKDIQIGDIMTVQLTGKGFQIEPIGREERFVPVDGYSQWEWNVIPLESGEQSLLLSVGVKIMIPDRTDQYYIYPVFEEKIIVEVSPIYVVQTFVSKYWQFIVASIIIPIIGWQYNKNKKGKKR